jgi:SAM-dependent methyltransferase
MKTRESGMPSEDVWETFFRPDDDLRLVGLSADCRDVVEFGCGYGTFALPAAKLIRGTIYALDIDPEMVKRTAQRAWEAGLTNVRAVQGDFLADPPPILQADYAMLFNILHAEKPELLLERASATLCPGGLLGIMHWNYDPKTPRGPSMDIRPRPEGLRGLAEAAGFLIQTAHVDLPPWHYGIVAQKPDRK